MSAFRAGSPISRKPPTTNASRSLGAGRIALWARISSEAYFANLRVVRR